MIMKTNIKNIILGITLAFLASCNDQFLEKAPMDQLSDASYWKTETDLQLYCNNFYAVYFPGLGVGNGSNDALGVQVEIPYRDQISDNSATYIYQIIPAGQYITPTASGSGKWEWVNMRRLNYFLDNYNRATIEVEIKHIYAGEILFFKAFDYFEKVRLFGDVPWVSHVVNINSPELFAARTPRSVVMDSVLNIVNTAIDWLPAKEKAQNNRLNKDMALFLKARLCLYEGTYRKYHTELGLDGTKFLNEATNACETLMNSGHCTLYSTGDINNDYFKLFAQYSYASISEVILWKQYSDVQGLGRSFSRYYTQNLEQEGATRSFIEEFLCSDGLPVSVSPLFKGHDSIQSEFMNRDSRLQQTICNFGQRLLSKSSDGLKWNGNNPLPALNGMAAGLADRRCPTGYRIAKWWLDDPTDWDRVTIGMQACPIFRYAEVLLTYAEAKCELGQCTQAVLNNSLNLVRARVGMPSLNSNNIPSDPKLDGYYQQYCGYTPSPLLREIRRERRIELSFEGLRYDDLMRWKAGKFLTMPVEGIKFLARQFPMIHINQDVFLSNDGYILPYAQTLPNGRVFNENKNYLFPIPLTDLVLNPNLVQNSGWDTPTP